MITILVIVSLCGIYRLATGEIARGVRSSHSHLKTTPTNLPLPSVIGLFLLVVLKYAVRYLVERLGREESLKLDPKTQTYPLPSCSIIAPLTVSAKDRQQYHDAVLAAAQLRDPWSPDRGYLPLFLLVPLTNPLLLHLLAKFTNPVLPLGAVNVRNRCEFLDVETCRHLMTSGGKLEATGTMGGPALPGRPVKRGMEFDVVVAVTKDGRTVFKQIFTVLQFLRHRATSTKEDKAMKPREETPRYSTEAQSLRIDYEAPGRWARLCKDYNPIHVHPLCARLFGFPGRVAHGNLVAGMIMERFLAPKLEGFGNSSYVKVDFRRPMIVPMDLNVEAAAEQMDDAVSFQVSSLNSCGEGKVYVTGRMGRV